MLIVVVVVVVGVDWGTAVDVGVCLNWRNFLVLLIAAGCHLDLKVEEKLSEPFPGLK